MNNKSVADRPAQQSEKSLRWNLIQMVTLLGVVGLVFVMLLLYQVGRTHDDHAAATSLRLYDGLVSLKMRNLGTHVRDYTHWDEAVERLATAYDEEWWENNAGVYAVQTFDLSFSLAVDGHDNPRLISTADGTMNEPSAEVLTSSLRTLLAQARNKPVSEAVAIGMVWFEDAPHLAAAVRYLPETEEVVNPDPDALLVFAWSVPDYLLAVIGEIMERSLHHRAELPEGAVGISLILADGTNQGWVTWSEPKSPLAAVGLVLPALLAVLLIIIFLAFFARHARKLIVQLHDAEQNAQYQLTFHRIAAETATALTTTTSDVEFDTAVNQCLQRLGLLFEVDRSYVFQFSDDLAYTTNTHEWCADGISPEMNNLQNHLMDDWSWLTTRLLRDGLLYARVADLPPEAAAVKTELQRQEVQSFLHATTHGAHGKLAGFIGFDSVRKERSWRDDELDMLQTIAGVVGTNSVSKRIEQALRESEERFKALHNASFGGIAIHDQGVILDCNQGLSEISGFGHDELIGMDALLLIAEQSRETVMAHIRSDYEKPYEVFGLRKNGKEYPLRLDAKNIPYQGKMVRVVEFRDITERKRAQMALQQKNQEIEQFVNIVSHDLKSPLVTVKTFTGMLRMDLQGGDQQQINDDLNYIDKAAEKMQQLLDALLQFSRIGTVDAPAQTSSANQQVHNCLGSLAGILQQHQVQVSTGKLPQQLRGDPMHFGQIWQNLIENAVKYRGNQTQPQIEIGATQQGHDVVFYVRDNGMGIEPKHNERIFTLFSQLHPGSDGSGLGLALVKKIVSIYHGRIWVESAGKEKGSCFRFTLPGALKRNEVTE